MKKTTGQSLSIDDFLPKFARENNDPEKKEEQLKAKFRAMARRKPKQANGAK